MLGKPKLLAAALMVASPACSPEREHWASTESLNVKIDWDKVNQAYRDTTGPEDLETRLNQIYEGHQIISIAVTDDGVTGFFDKNHSGSVDEGEQIFTIKRGPTQYQTMGVGPYAGYFSPVIAIAPGTQLGAYTTSPARVSVLSSHKSGNSDGGGRPTSGASGMGRRAGGTFGLQRAGRAVRSVSIGELPVGERPILELLHCDDDRRDVDRTYAGYGWARVPRIWVGDTPVDDALVLALHADDDGEVLRDDIELAFELPDGNSVLVLASQFFAEWLPRLPQASAVVLALCNPHHAVVPYPAGARVPVYIASADVESWMDETDGRLELVTAGTWAGRVATGDAAITISGSRLYAWRAETGAARCTMNRQARPGRAMASASDVVRRRRQRAR